jgi:hypothetical protein
MGEWMGGNQQARQTGLEAIPVPDGRGFGSHYY